MPRSTRYPVRYYGLGREFARTLPTGGVEVHYEGQNGGTCAVEGYTRPAWARIVRDMRRAARGRPELCASRITSFRRLPCRQNVA